MGCDITITSAYTHENTLFQAAKAVLSVWTNGIIEDREIIPLSYLFGGPHKEVFVYKNMEAYLQWTEKGWTELHGKEMVYMFMTPGAQEVTCVVDDLNDPDLSRLIDVVTHEISP